MNVEKLKAAAQACGNYSWRWWDSNSVRRLTFESYGRHMQDGGALCAVKCGSDDHADVQMAPGVREFIELCSPATIVHLCNELSNHSAAEDAFRDCVVKGAGFLELRHVPIEEMTADAIPAQIGRELQGKKFRLGNSHAVYEERGARTRLRHLYGVDSESSLVDALARHVEILEIQLKGAQAALAQEQP